jgi:hypothetical protein
VHQVYLCSMNLVAVKASHEELMHNTWPRATGRDLRLLLLANSQSQTYLAIYPLTPDPTQLLQRLLTATPLVGLSGHLPLARTARGTKRRQTVAGS